MVIVLPIDPTADRARRAWLECPRCEHGRACAVCQSSRNCGNHWQFLLSNQGTLVHLQCPSCGERWESPLEPADFVWREINAACRRLLRQIHVLASAYGWSESEILRLSHERRAGYLHLIEEAGTMPNS